MMLSGGIGGQLVSTFLSIFNMVLAMLTYVQPKDSPKPENASKNSKRVEAACRRRVSRGLLSTDRIRMMVIVL